ncbi:glutaredoxin [Aeromonas phage Asfd_1]|nr:glutaredoxin [Aeromonas phage Asfd_1]
MIEIYGIMTDPNLVRCHACDSVVERLDYEELDYVFKTILRATDNELGFSYDRPVIDELRKRINKPKGVLTVPYIFVNGTYIGGAQALFEYLES